MRRLNPGVSVFVGQMSHFPLFLVNEDVARLSTGNLFARKRRVGGRKSSQCVRF